MSKLILNGKLQEAGAPLFSARNRAFCYGDAIFETIRIQGGIPLFISDHLSRLRAGMEYLRLKPVQELNERVLSEMSSLLASENKIPEAGRLRLQVFRHEGGFYISTASDASFVVTAEALEQKNFTLNEKGYMVDVFTEGFRTRDRLSNLKSSNKLPFVLAGFFMKEKGLDECLMLNTDGNIAEAINSNIFLVRKDVLYTPSADQGCIEGIMRKNIIRIASNAGKKVHECIIQPGDMLEADEVFLTNSINGIRWVVAYKNKRFFNGTSRWLIDELNKEIGRVGSAAGFLR